MKRISISTILANLLIVGTIVSVTARASETQLTSSDSDAINTMIVAGESEAALIQIEEELGEIAKNHGRSSVLLIKPLVLKGDALSSLGLYDVALETYRDARSLQRRHFGLHDLAQTEVLYKEAQIYYDQELFTEANDSQEYAFSIYLRKYGDDSPEILPGLFKLADWYMETNNIFTARGLYEKVLENFDANEALAEDGNDETTDEAESEEIETELAQEETDSEDEGESEDGEEEVVEKAKIDDVSRIRALAGLAQSYRYERFRPSTFSSKSKKFTPRPYGSINHPEHYYATLNDFAKGEEALLEIIKLNLLEDDPHSYKLADAKLQLADWYLLFEKFDRAGVVYKDIWQSLEGTSGFSFVERNLMTPQALYQPLPLNPPRPKREATIPHIELEGRIEFEFTVTETGEVKDVRRVSSYPGHLLNRETKESAESSIYRPAFINGVATTSENVNFVHTFPYYTRSRNSSGSKQRFNASYRNPQ